MSALPVTLPDYIRDELPDDLAAHRVQAWADARVAAERERWRAAIAPEVHPVQMPQMRREQGWAPTAVTLAAYEVYSYVHGPQEALVTGSCRGGFSTGELIAFLYASSFPKAEWRARVTEAFRGAKHL